MDGRIPATGVLMGSHQVGPAGVFYRNQGEFLWKIPVMNGEGKTSICLFGAHPVRIDGQPFCLGISGSTEKLFQYLLVHAGTESRREYLAELFWGRSSPARQRSALNSAIFRIRQHLVDVEGVELVCSGPVVVLQVAASIPMDARDFTRIVHSVSIEKPMSQAMADELHVTLNACSASFMDGVSADWVLTERERMFNLQIRGLIILMHWLGQEGRYEDALEVGRSLLAADPARESAQCEVMWLYVLNGQRAQALRQYQEFHAWLESELDIEPMPETRALYEYIRTDLGIVNTKLSDQVEDIQTQRAAFNKLLGNIGRFRRDLYATLISASR